MIKKVLFFIIPIVLVFAYGMKPKDKPTRSQDNTGNTPYRIMSTPDNLRAVDSKKLDVNQISTWFRSNGSFNRDPSTGNSGFEWPKGQSKFARYASGIWIGAVVDGDTLVCIAEYDYEYLPGYVDDNGNPQGNDDPNYRIYNLSSTDTSDYGPWRTIAAGQGAYLDSAGNPLLLGSQTMFYSYTDGYASAHGNNAGSTAPLKAQILQTNWSYNVNGPLSNMSFSEFRIINRSNQPWTKCYIALWTDDDLGDANDDACAVDTTLDLGITYNFDNNDPNYGVAPPAVGFDYFRGPIVPSPGDTVRYFQPPGSNNLIVKPNFRELGVSAFNTYSNGDPSVGDPSNFRETYLNLQGIKKNGTPWVTPGGDTTTFAYSGDPSTGGGWNETSGGDRRFMQCSGPLVVNPGDTQSIIVAQVIARGENNLKSVKALKEADDLAQRIFDNNFAVPDAAKCPNVSSYAPGNGKIYLSWGDENERNDSIVNKLSGGVYRFQGYNVYQIVPGTNGSTPEQRTLIATYDLIDGIGDIKDSVLLPEYGTYAVIVVQKGTNNGISRYIVLDKDYITNTFIVSGTPYYYSVTAYYYDSIGGITPRVNESPVQSCVIQVIPQTLSAGTQVNYGLGDTVYTSNRDLGVMPIIIEPLNLKSAAYESVYGGTNARPTWSLYRTLSGGSRELLYENIDDFSGTQDTARTIDGFLMIHQVISDSGLVPDPGLPSDSTKSRQIAWTYDPPGGEWFVGPDTNAVKTAKIITNRQFQSRSLGMSFPTNGTFRNSTSRVKANGQNFVQTGTSPILNGGPLRKIQIKFGPEFTSKAYRYVPTDTNYTNTPYNNMVDVPFSAFMVDELDSTGGAPRQMNVAFMDADNSGTWNPKGGTANNFEKLGGYEFTYILASVYNPNPDNNYTNKNPGLASPTLGFPAMDVMYGWLPRLRSGVTLESISGTLTVTPYRITKPNFVPGYPMRYSWNVTGTQTNDDAVASSKIDKVGVFPNPYFGGSSLETDPFDRFIYFSNLPPKCTIYIYTLDGILVRKIVRDNNDPNNSLERWDLQNANQIPVASGMYIAYVDAGSIGAKTLKIAIFAPTERIQTF
ncbi:MAG: hypothetical protein K1X85_05065 [Ignavibacteria bacterium]|nr:hypothetical protein [Ignavibacteria bacterium]